MWNVVSARHKRGKKYQLKVDRWRVTGRLKWRRPPFWIAAATPRRSSKFAPRSIPVHTDSFFFFFSQYSTILTTICQFEAFNFVHTLVWVFLTSQSAGIVGISSQSGHFARVVASVRSSVARLAKRFIETSFCSWRPHKCCWSSSYFWKDPRGSATLFCGLFFFLFSFFFLRFHDP